MRSRRNNVALVAVGLLLLVPLVYLLVRAIDGASRLVDRDVVGLGQSGDTYAALPWLIVATIAAVAALIGWFVTSRSTTDEHSLAADRGEELRALRSAYEKQRQWSQKLSSELNDLHRRDGPLGGPDDIGTLLLRVAIELLNAEKGLLLSARDADGDGKLDVVAVQGFQSDPERSSLVQRFGREVIERDTIIRIDPEDAPDADSGADREIENAVAIPIYISDEFHGAVICANGDALGHQDEVLVALGDHAGAILENSELHGRLRGSYLATVKMLADALEVKDPFLRGHSEEVSGLTTAMARRLELPGERREQLLFGSLLHDIGKIGVSERILLKPGPLTEEEYAEVKLHPRIGYRLVAQVPLLEGVAPAILHHHERYDGSGYPTGLSGERIPLEARVIAIIDAFSAMVSDRPYQAGVPVQEALAELERCAGTQFDPALVTMFVEIVLAGVPEGEAPTKPLADALDDPELTAMREAIGLGGAFSATDSQTLLLSHGAFRERFDAEVAGASLGDGDGEPGPSLVIVRVANLPILNEEHGYNRVDGMLEMLGRVAEKVVAPSDGYAGRLSGSRIVLTLPRTGAAELGGVIAAIEAAAPDELVLECTSTTWTAGLGAGNLLDGGPRRAD